MNYKLLFINLNLPLFDEAAISTHTLTHTQTHTCIPSYEIYHSLNQREDIAHTYMHTHIHTQREKMNE